MIREKVDFRNSAELTLVRLPAWLPYIYQVVIFVLIAWRDFYQVTGFHTYFK